MSGTTSVHRKLHSSSPTRGIQQPLCTDHAAEAHKYKYTMTYDTGIAKSRLRRHPTLARRTCHSSERHKNSTIFPHFNSAAIVVNLYLEPAGGAGDGDARRAWLSLE
jgi:hypothetical protein